MAGFKIAEAYVEVEVQDDTDAGLRGLERKVTESASKTGDKAGDRLAEGMGKGGERGSDKFTDRFEKHTNRDSRGRFVKAGLGLGVSVGTSMGTSGIQAFAQVMGNLGAAMPPQVKVAGAALGVGLVVAATPALAAGISGAILAGAGSAVVAGGIALALKDPRVYAAATDLGTEITTTLTQAASSFIGPSLSAITKVRAGWRSLLPDIEGSFQAASRYVDPLVEGFTGLVSNIMPSFRRMIEAAGPAIVQMSQGLKGTGIALSGLFDTVAENANEGASAIQGALELVNMGIKTTSQAIGIAASAWQGYTSVVATGAGIFEDWLGWLPLVGDHLARVNDVFERLNATARGEGLATVATYFGPIKQGAETTTSAYQALTAEQVRLSGSMSAGIAVAGSLSAAFDALNGKAVSARQAESNFQAAVDAATASVKTNGATLDLNTEKGRANDRSLQALIASSKAKAQATYDETYQTKGAAAAQQAAIAAYNSGRSAIEAAGRAMGLTAAQASALADELYGIPPSWSRTYTQTIQTNYRVSGTPSMGNSRYPGINSANGNVIEAYAGGGIRRENHVAQMAKAGAYRLWAEPETGGESYIPHALSKRRRSVELLKQTNDILGSPMVDPMSTPNRATGGDTYHVTINADMSQITSVGDVVHLLSGIRSTARTYRGSSVQGART